MITPQGIPASAQSQTGIQCKFLKGTRVVTRDQCLAVTPGTIANRAKSGAWGFSTESKYSLDVRSSYSRDRETNGDLNQHMAIITMLSVLQHAMGVYGAVGEIGVAKGFFTIALAHTAAKGERIFVADVFSDKGNSDPSGGVGDLEIFLSNLGQFGISEEDMDLFKGTSDKLPADYAMKYQPLRLLSVDGGHTVTAAQGDLMWAGCNIVDGAIVVVDDVWHPDWPEVSEAVYRDLACSHIEWYPFYFNHGQPSKYYMTNNKKAHDVYLKMIQQHPSISQHLDNYGGVKHAELSRNSNAARIESTDACPTCPEYLSAWNEAIEGVVEGKDRFMEDWQDLV